MTPTFIKKMVDNDIFTHANLEVFLKKKLKQEVVFFRVVTKNKIEWKKRIRKR